MATGCTRKSNRRVHRHPGTAQSNVHPVRRRRQRCTRRRLAKRLSSLGTTPRKIDLVRASIASSLAICRISISVVVDDVAVLADFLHGLELGVGDDVHSGRQRDSEKHLDAQVALLYQTKAGVIALVGGQVNTEEGVAVPEVAARQSVPLILSHLTGRGEQVHVAPDEVVVVEIRLEKFGGYMSPVHLHGEEVDFVVLGRKRILRTYEPL